MIRRVVASMLVLVGVFVAPAMGGSATPIVGAANGMLTPLNPVRLLDTRPGGETIDGRAQRTGMPTAKTTLELQVTGRGGVPADASAVMLNVTAATPTGLGFITIYPCGIDRPNASNLNFTATTIPNAVLTKIGVDGKVCIYTETTTHILADVNAYVPTGASPSPLNPARLLDTRPTGTTIDGQSQRTGIQAGKTTFELQVTGRGGVPADAAAVMLNVTAVTPTGLGFITAYPCGIDRPLASNLNFTNTTIPNAVLAKIGVDGKVCIYTETTTHILADVNAYVPKGASPTPLNPARLLDTRPTGTTIDGQAQQTGIQTSKTTFELQAAGRGGVPADASAVMLNVTAVTPTGLGHITVYPCGIDRPNASSLNFATTTIPNAVLAKIGADGKVCIYTETATHILADVNAYVPANSDSARPTGSTTPTASTSTTTGPPKPTCGATSIPVSECTALVAFFQKMDGPNWRSKAGWNTPADPCSWYGVTCSTDKSHVESLDLATNRLTGSLPAEIGNLTNLTDLDLYGNQVTPTSVIGKLTSLRELSLGQNQLSSLPTEIGKLTNLQVLAIQRNKFTALPTEITKLSKLQQLYLFENQIATLPSTIGNLAQLTRLGLSKNRLTALPPEIGRLTKLEFLDLTYNQFKVLPAEIGKLTQLTDLRLLENQLTAIPTTIGNLTKLTEVDLYNNKLTSLPPEIGNLTNLTSLKVQQNQLTAIPTTVGNLTKLTTLLLDGNQLAAIPTTIGNLTKLTWLDLGANKLIALPSEISKLTKLGSLEADNNKLTAVPPQIFTLPNLIAVDLNYNQLTAIPPQIFSVSNLTYLQLTGNLLTAVPADIGKLTKLTNLGLGENKLTTLPPEIANLTDLTTLILASNQISKFPSEIFKFTKLATLDLGINKLTAVPPEIGALTKLVQLDLHENALTALPASLGNLTNLTSLYVNDNRLTTPPPQVGKLTNLTSLDMGDNKLAGDVTTAFGPLRLAGKITYLRINGEGCMTTTDDALAAWLTKLDAKWRGDCLPVSGTP